MMNAIGTRIICVQLLVAFALLNASYGLLEHSDTGCWNSDQSCLIHATLHRLDEPLSSEGLTFDIDCQLSAASSAATPTSTQMGEHLAKTHPLHRLEHVKSVRLDGCHTHLSVNTFGLEFLPNCDNIPEVIVEHFHADVLQPLLCSGMGVNDSVGLQRLEMLRYRHNELATIGADALSNVPQLRELYFASNSLRHIARNAFDALRQVEHIQLEHEPLLALKDAGLFEHSSVSTLHLAELKAVTAALLSHLPETLRQLYIAHTKFDDDADSDSDGVGDGDGDGVITVYNPHLLRNISIIDCALEMFVLRESAATTSVRHINVSGNALLDFRVEFADASNGTVSGVETLDLSANGLMVLPLAWLSALGRLRWLSLRGNHLKTLSLAPLLSWLPSVRHIDVRYNEISQLTATTSSVAASSPASEYWDYTRLQIDGNPWNCMWLLDFAHTHPEKFRIFQYDKFISHINVNGLTCTPEETLLDEEPYINVATTATNNAFAQQEPAVNSSAANASTFTVIYGGPWDYKRSQRAEALIIVFMLPLGVALLFIILYMWINCQKIFHLSYYRSCAWSQRNLGGRFRSAERFDVVRQLPPITTTSTMVTALNGGAATNNNDGYETPLSGVGSICNCNNIASAPYGNEKCRKSHHITYVELPSEQPYKIYEEIIGDDEDAVQDTDTDTYAQPFYDHLSYSQPRSDNNESI